MNIFNDEGVFFGIFGREINVYDKLLDKHFSTFFEIFRIKNWKRKGRRISTITVYKLKHLINFLKKGKIILLF